MEVAKTFLAAALRVFYELFFQRACHFLNIEFTRTATTLVGNMTILSDNIHPVRHGIEGAGDSVTNVIDEHPDVVRKMRGELYRWWDEVGPNANVPQRVVIGSDHENPSRLTACEWLDVFVDQQGQIRRGQQKSGYWLLDVAQDGEYEFELRRWPRDADIPLTEAMPDGVGKALPITSASIFLNNYHHLSVGQKRPYGFEGLTKQVKAGDKSVVFTANLKRGPIALHTWFRGEDTIFSAYYVYVRRKD